jgi:hypothetical protein
LLCLGGECNHRDLGAGGANKHASIFCVYHMSVARSPNAAAVLPASEQSRQHSAEGTSMREEAVRSIVSAIVWGGGSSADDVARGCAQWSVRGIVVFFTLYALAIPASAAVIHVTTTQQGIGVRGCSLQEAIYSANFDKNVAISEIEPDGPHFVATRCEPGNGDDVIVLPAGQTLQMSAIVHDAYNPHGPTATPIVYTNITIEGSGAHLVWAGEIADPKKSTNARAFTVGTASVVVPGGIATSGTGHLTIRNVHIKGFVAKGGDGVAGGGGGLGAGGAIYVYGGLPRKQSSERARLTVENSTFEANFAVGGAGASGFYGHGGGGGGIGGAGGMPTCDPQPYLVTPGPCAGAGGGGGGSKGKGGDAYLDEGGGGGGTSAPGAFGEGGPGSSYFGLLCGASGGDSGDDGFSASCPGGGGGGGGQPSVYSLGGLGLVTGGQGGDGAYGGGGGGGGVSDTSAVGGDHTGPAIGRDGGNGGFGGGGGACAGVGMFTDNNGGKGGFGGGAGLCIDGDSGAKGQFAGQAVDGGNGNDAGGSGAGLGGAIFNLNGVVIIRNSTFIANDAVGGRSGPLATGFASTGAGHGGAIFSLNGSTDVFNATIARNESTGSGGGVYVWQSSKSDSSIGENETTFILRNTIIANNGGSDVAAAKQCVMDVSVVTGGDWRGNLIQNDDPDHPCDYSLQFPSGIASIDDPQLGPLQMNGGLTPTMAISKDTPAWGKADGGTSLANDQRGMPRPSLDGHGYDIGAFELCVPRDPIALECLSRVFTDGTITQTLTVQTSSAVAGRIDPAPGKHTVEKGSVIIVTATPNPGYCFAKWTGNVVDSKGASSAVIMNGDRRVIANFVRCDGSGLPRFPG